MTISEKRLNIIAAKMAEVGCVTVARKWSKQERDAAAQAELAACWKVKRGETCDCMASAKELVEDIAHLEAPVGEDEVEAVITKMLLRRPDAQIGQQHYSLDEVVANMAEAATLIRRLQSAATQAQKELEEANAWVTNWKQSADQTFATLAKVALERDDLKKENETLKIAATQAQDKGDSVFLKMLERQRAWSLTQFGPGLRTEGNTKHIEKELAEIRAEPTDVEEWIDVAMLAIDGAWRAGATSQQIIDGYSAKLEKNINRLWPEPTADGPVEHVRALHPLPPKAPG